MPIVQPSRYVLLTKITAAQNEDALSYRARGLYFLAVVFATNIVSVVRKLVIILLKVLGHRNTIFSYNYILISL